MALALRLWQTRIVKTLLLPTRGYFAIGVEGISKAVNLGNLLRSGHAFGASFAFTIGADAKALQTQADTSKASTHLPVYHWRSQAELELPKGCSLVGVEILDAAQDLPSFPHPLRAAYVLGPERGALSPDLAHAANIWCAFRPPSHSMSPPPALLSCTIACVRSGASPRARWPGMQCPSWAWLMCKGRRRSAGSGVDPAL
jgi:hypothetical protein